MRAIDDGLLKAAYEGETETVGALILAGADVNVRDRKLNTPLILAAANGRSGAIKVLISAGADVEAIGENSKSPLDLIANENRRWGKKDQEKRDEIKSWIKENRPTELMNWHLAKYAEQTDLQQEDFTAWKAQEQKDAAQEQKKQHAPSGRYSSGGR